MKECWDEGALRAYLDRELPSDELTQIAVHLGGCSECDARYHELTKRAARVAACMEALEVSERVAPSSPGRHWIASRPVAAILAVAAAALAFVLVAKRTESPRSVAPPRVAPARAVMQQAAAPAVEAPAEAIAPEAPTPVKAKSVKRAKPPQVRYYLALDNEPIDTGVVMRVALGDTAVEADVIFDSDGRPRAIRTAK